MFEDTFITIQTKVTMNMQSSTDEQFEQLKDVARNRWIELSTAKRSVESTTTCYELYEEESEREKRYVQEIIYNPGIYLPLNFREKQVEEIVHESFLELLLFVSKDPDLMNKAWSTNELWLQELASIAYILYALEN